MQKHIEKIENIYSIETIRNLSIDKLGHFNLFSGKNENGYEVIMSSIMYKYKYNENYKVINDFLYDYHYSDLKPTIRAFFIANQQIFATTQRYDVIKAFAEVAQEYKDVEAYYYRLGRSARNSNKGQSIATMYDIDALLDATKQNIEVR